MVKMALNLAYLTEEQLKSFEFNKDYHKSITSDRINKIFAEREIKKTKTLSLLKNTFNKAK
jgi:hypothetical protein